MKEDELAQVVTMSAVSTTMAGMFRDCAIVGALSQRGVVSPLEVAAWADMFSNTEVLPNVPPEVRDLIAKQLKEFSAVLRSMASKPAGAGRA